MTKSLNGHFPSIEENMLQEELMELGLKVSYQKGELIMKSGQSFDHFPMVISGSVKVMRQDEEGNEILMYYLNPEKHPCMLLLFSLRKRKSEVVAIAEQETKCLLIPIDKLATWSFNYPSWRNLVRRAYNKYVKEMMNVIDRIAFSKIDQRLEAYLMQKLSIERTLIIEVTHQQIAHDLNVSRETISRLLKRLEAEEKIVLMRNKIKIIEKNFTV